MMEFANSWSVALVSAHAVFCVILALYLRRDRSHAPVFFYVFGFFLVDRARTVTGMILDNSPVPYVGADAAVLHIDRFLYLLGGSGFAFLCGHVFHSPSVKKLAIVALVAPFSFLLATYPQESHIVGLVYATAESCVLVFAWVAAFRAALGYADIRPDFRHLVVLILLGADSASFLVVYLDNFAAGTDGLSAAWSPLMAATFLGYAFCISLYAARLLVPGRAPAKPSETPS